MIKLLGDWAPLDRNVVECDLNKFIFLNIEGPVIENQTSKLPKAGPSIYNKSFIKTRTKGVGILANNHLFDYGNKGYKKTLKVLNENGWFAVGAGVSKEKARKPLIVKLRNISIGVVATCETQFGISGIDKPGVSSFDPSIYKEIYNLKKKADIIIVSYHGAAEMLPWPSTARQELFRSLVDAGADIIYGHHSHTPQGWERYSNGLIFYGLGNYCVDPAKWSWHPNGNWSLAPEISYVDKKIKFKIKTTIIKDHGKKISVNHTNKKEFAKHLSYLKLCNEPLKNRKLLEGLWQEASLKMYYAYYSNWLGINFSKKNKIYLTLKSFFGNLIREIWFKKNQQLKKKRYLLYYHMFACDSHKEAISTALGVLGGELKDFRNKKTKNMVDKWMIDKL